MKKNILIVIVCILILTVIISVGCTEKLPVINNASSKVSLGGKAYSYLKTISEVYPNRTAGGAGDAAFVEYISQFMLDQSYVVENQDFVITSNGKTTSNIICSKSARNSQGKILFACQWDNCYELFENANPDGAYESGSAIATLMVISEYLSKISLAYDVEVVFFGAGVDNWFGATYYLNKLTKEDKQEISLMVNYSMLGAGDNIYMYSRDIETNYNQYFYSVAQKNNLELIKSIPKDKRIIDSQLLVESPYQYCHIGMFGNNYVFMNEYIPSLSYLSFNWEDKTKPAYVELANKENVYETSMDTFENMINRVGMKYIEDNLNTVIASTIYTVVNNDVQLMLILEDADEMPQWINSTGAKYIGSAVVKIVIVGIVLCLMALAKGFIKKNKDKYMPYIQKIKTEEDNEEDVIDEDVFQ